MTNNHDEKSGSTPQIFGQILGTFQKILGMFWVIFEPTADHERRF